MAGAGTGKRPWAQFTKPLPDIHRGTIPPVQIERIRRRRAAGDVDDGIDPAHFVKVNLFRWNAMDAALCLRQQAKGVQAEVASALGQIRVHEQAANLGQAATVLMHMVMVVGGMLMLVIMVRWSCVVLVLDRPGNGGRLMQPAIDHHIDLGRLNAAPAYPGDV